MEPRLSRTAVFSRLFGSAPLAGVRTKVLGLVLAALLPLLASEAADAYHSYNHRVDTELQQRREFAWQMAGAFSNYLNGLWLVADTLGLGLAEHGNLENSPYGSELAQYILEKTHANSPMVRTALWLDAKGTVLAASRPSEVGHSFAGRVYVQALMDGQLKVVSDLFADPGSGRAVVHVGRAIREGRRLRGIVLLEPDLGRIGSILPAHWGGTVVSGLVDRRGKVVYQTGEPDSPYKERSMVLAGPVGEALAGSEAYSKAYRGASGDQVVRVGAAVPVDGVGWVVHSSTLTSSIWTAALDETWDNMKGALPLALLGIVGAFMAGNRLARPLVALRLAAEEVSRGNLFARVRLARHDELAAAAQAFDEMVERIQGAEEELRRAQDGLERRVHERTIELVTAYAELQEQVVGRHQTEEARQESERRLRSIFDRAFGFIGLMSPDGRILDINQTALDFFGLSRENAVGEPIWEVDFGHLPEAADAIHQAVSRAAAGELERHELNLRSAYGQTVLMDITLKPVVGPDGKVNLVILEGRDISSIKAAEEALRLKEIAEERDRAHGQLLHIAAHELRNPMAAVKGIVQLLHRRLDAGWPPEQMAGLTVVLEQEVDRLSALLNELLDAFRVQEGRLPLKMERVDLRLIADAAIRPFQISSERHRFVVTMSGRKLGRGEEMERAGEPVWVRGDHRRLEEVFRNLLSNAVKYSPDGGTIGIDLDARGGRAHVAISDDGVGIPSDQIDRVFEPFFRASNLAGRDPGGLGLGLYICRDIVQRHGGRVWAESADDRGTVFHVELPLLADV